ncbi:MAG: helix-turn-helix domain-containing protein [Micropruina sp.]|uniref:helix-turn-helix domain-containing protein n=1 Tax=Micropruina sp. TaxID=2737536 RepID=UPI0039E38330
MSLALRLSPADLADRERAAESVLAFLRQAEMAGASVEITADAPFLTPEEVAKQLGVSRPTISRRIKAGDLKVIKVGNRNRIPVTEFERFREAYLDEMASALADDF